MTCDHNILIEDGDTGELIIAEEFAEAIYLDDETQDISIEEC